MRTNIGAAGIVGLVILAAFTIWIDRQAKAVEIGALATARTPALSGKRAPDFSLAALDGHTVSAADYRGKRKVAVLFWASWCGPCRTEIPVLNRFYAMAHKPDSDFDMVAISVDDDAAAASQFASEMKIPYPVLLDRGMKTADAFRVDSVPTIFIVDRDGKVEYARAGYAPGEEMLMAQRLGVNDFMPFQGGFRVRRGN
jgi:peroxiredoxin